MIPICRHCSKANVTRPRGLCWVCYYTPGVRVMFPSPSKFHRRGPGHDGSPSALPSPTDALPGTAEKIRVIAERLRDHQELHHPFDATWKE